MPGKNSVQQQKVKKGNAPKNSKNCVVAQNRTTKTKNGTVKEKDFNPEKTSVGVKSEIPKNELNNLVRKNKSEKVESQPVNITLAGFCAICWKAALYFCPDCRIIGYCCLSHMANHWCKHRSLCTVINKITETRGNLYGASVETPDSWRYLRITTLETCKLLLKRSLESYERDLLLFPKYCGSCYETRPEKLSSCKECHQVWYCTEHKSHLTKNHGAWCKKLQLFATLVRKQAENKLFMFDMNFGSANLEKLDLNKNDNIEKVIRAVLQDSENLDDCTIAMLSQAASGPLTILYALHTVNFHLKKSVTIHLIGAELHYEGSTLQAWESFFLHFAPAVTCLKVIMVGPELNATTSSDVIRLCDGCRSRNKSLVIEYKDNLLYHEYANNKCFVKPDIVCAFNPGLHRNTGFNQDDTWPQTIRSAVSNHSPFIFTAYTSYEAPLDLERVQNSAPVHVAQRPHFNPFSSLKPDRNFISDHEAPLIFKNYYLSVVRGVN